MVLSGSSVNHIRFQVFGIIASVPGQPLHLGPGPKVPTCSNSLIRPTGAINSIVGRGNMGEVEIPGITELLTEK